MNLLLISECQDEFAVTECYHLECLIRFSVGFPTFFHDFPLENIERFGDPTVWSRKNIDI